MVPEKLISPKSTHKQTKYQYTGQSPIKAKPQREGYKQIHTAYYLEEASINLFYSIPGDSFC